jgi:hypothetical protein
MARRRRVGIRGRDGMARRRRVRRAGVPQRVRHCCGRSGAPVHLRIRKEEEDAAPECSPGRELVRGQHVETGRLSVTRGGGACAGGRMRGRAGTPADECGQVASMRALLAKARTGGPLPGGRAGGRAGDAMQMLRQACEKARQRMSARAGRLRGCARCWPKRGRAGGRADRCQATPCDSCGMHARKRARRCTAYSAESPGPPPAPVGG